MIKKIVELNINQKNYFYHKSKNRIKKFDRK